MKTKRVCLACFGLAFTVFGFSQIPPSSLPYSAPVTSEECYSFGLPVNQNLYLEVQEGQLRLSEVSREQQAVKVCLSASSSTPARFKVYGANDRMLAAIERQCVDTPPNLPKTLSVEDSARITLYCAPASVRMPFSGKEPLLIEGGIDAVPTITESLIIGPGAIPPDHMEAMVALLTHSEVKPWLDVSVSDLEFEVLFQWGRGMMSHAEANDYIPGYNWYVGTFEGVGRHYLCEAMKLREERAIVGNVELQGFWHDPPRYLEDSLHDITWQGCD